MAMAVQQIHPIAHLPLVLGVLRRLYSSAEIHWFESGSPLGIPCSHQHLE